MAAVFAMCLDAPVALKRNVVGKILSHVVATISGSAEKPPDQDLPL
jgi:hypothetical protein